MLDEINAFKMINFGAFAKNDRLINSIHCARAWAIKKAFIFKLYAKDNGHDGNEQREMSLYFEFVVFFWVRLKRDPN